MTQWQRRTDGLGLVLKQIEFWVLVPEDFFFIHHCYPTQSRPPSDHGFFSTHIFLMMGVAALIMRSRNHSAQPACVECGPGEAFFLKQLGLVTLYCYFTQVTTWSCWIVYLMTFKGGGGLWDCCLHFVLHLYSLWQFTCLVALVCLEFSLHLSTFNVA